MIQQNLMWKETWSRLLLVLVPVLFFKGRRQETFLSEVKNNLECERL